MSEWVSSNLDSLLLSLIRNPPSSAFTCSFPNPHPWTSANRTTLRLQWFLSENNFIHSIVAWHKHCKGPTFVGTSGVFPWQSLIPLTGIGVVHSIRHYIWLGLIHTQTLALLANMHALREVGGGRVL